MVLIHNATIINEGDSFRGSLLIKGDRIKRIYRAKVRGDTTQNEGEDVPEQLKKSSARLINAEGLYLIPGIIDSHVHFREPGLTAKGDIFSESRAAVAGGVTSYMEMPNTDPQTVTIERLEQKMEMASLRSAANFSFYLGATNSNIVQLKRADKKHICGVKVFMGSSTGNMLVDGERVLQQIFAEVDNLIATHCEKEEIISENIEKYRKSHGPFIPIACHTEIRSSESCYQSSAKAVELAQKYGSRLHILHLSTASEMSLLSNNPLEEKMITGEACPHHLWFSNEDYERLGAKIKWNPSIKTVDDRDALRNALRSGKLDSVATDHAPHLLSEKEGDCLNAMSGGPLVQHSLQLMFELVRQGLFSKELVVEKMSHAPAKLFKIKERGFIREGYYADLVLIDPLKQQTITKDNIFYKCGWSPFEGERVSSSVSKTFVNGSIVYDDGAICEKLYGRAIEFDR